MSSISNLYTTTNTISQTNTIAPTDTDTDTDTVQKCAICMNDYTKQKNKVALGCGHEFHYECLLKWNLQSTYQTNHKSCPMCRTDIGISEILDESGVEHISHVQETTPLTPQQRTRFENKTVQEISDIDQGLFICCRDCGDKLIPCCMPECESQICNCEYIEGDYRWGTREFYCPSNPYSKIEYNYNSTQLFNENPPAHCSRCFENRDRIIFDYLDGVYNWEEILETSDKIEDYYYLFYRDTSENDNTSVYESYPTFTYEEFKTYIHQGYMEIIREYDDDITYINSTGEEILNINYEGFQNELILEDEFNEAAISREVINTM